MSPRDPEKEKNPFCLHQAVSFNFLPSQYQAGLALEESKHKAEGQKEHTEVLQDAVWK